MKIIDPLISYIKEDIILQNAITFVTLSPIIIRHYQRKDRYDIPNEEGFNESFFNAIMEQLSSYYDNCLDLCSSIKFKILNYKKVVMTHYGGLVLGFIGVLQISANSTILKTFYQCGLGYRRVSWFWIIKCVSLMKVFLGDWIINAGIIGYLRLLSLSNRKPDLTNGYLLIDKWDSRNIYRILFYCCTVMNISRSIFRIQSNMFLDLRKRINYNVYVKVISEFDRLKESNFNAIKPNFNNFDLTLDSVIENLLNLKINLLRLCDRELVKFGKEVN